MPRRDNAAMHPLAIVSAMPEELAALLPLVEQRRVQRLAGRELHHGQLQGREVVLTPAGQRHLLPRLAPAAIRYSARSASDTAFR